MDTTEHADGLDLGKLEALEKAATPGVWEWSRWTDGDSCRIGPHTDPMLNISDDVTEDADAAFITALRNAAPALFASVHALAAANARIAELEGEVVTFLALWASRHAEMQGLDGLHPQHYDRLKELGARMDDFKRAAITPAPLATNPAR